MKPVARRSRTCETDGLGIDFHVVMELSSPANENEPLAADEKGCALMKPRPAMPVNGMRMSVHDVRIASILISQKGV